MIKTKNAGIQEAIRMLREMSLAAGCDSPEEFQEKSRLN